MKLDVVVSLVHLKVTYLNKEGRSTTVSADLDEAKQIKELDHRDTNASMLRVEEDSRDTNTFNPDNEYESI